MTTSFSPPPFLRVLGTRRVHLSTEGQGRAPPVHCCGAPRNDYDHDGGDDGDDDDDGYDDDYDGISLQTELLVCALTSRPVQSGVASGFSAIVPQSQRRIVLFSQTKGLNKGRLRGRGLESPS